MKHAMKQLIALLLVLLLVVGITACSTTSQGESNATNQGEGNTAEGSENNTTEEPTQNTVEANQTEDRGVQFPLENEVTLTMMVANVNGVDYEKDLAKCAYWQDLYEATNVKVEIIAIPADDPLSTVNAMFQSGSEGDIILLQNTVKQDTDFCSMIANGLFMDITEYVDNPSLMPNLYERVFAESPETRGMMTAPDGGVYCLPTRNATTWSMLESPMYINKTWLDKAGMKVEDIKTIDDLEKVLTYFAENDMNGNGIDDEIPFLLCQANNNAHVEAFCSLYGIPTKGGTTESGLYIEDGEVKIAYTTQNYKDAILKLNDWYEKGLIWDQAFTATGNDFNAIVQTDTIGLCFRVNAPAGDEYVALNPVSVDGYSPSFFVNPGIICTNKQVALTRSCEEPEIALAWLDLFYTYDSAVRVTYGEPTDGFYEIVDGELVLNDLSAEEKAEILEKTPNLQWLMQMITCRTSEDYAERIGMSDADMQKLTTYEAYDAAGALNDEIWPRPLMSEDVAVRLSELRTDIFNMINTKRASWIEGSADINAEWDQYIDDLNKMHIDEFVELNQEAYDVFLDSVSAFNK